MSASAFSRYNVSVWLLDRQGQPEYVTAHNETIEELERQFGRSDTKVGLHAEVLVGQQVFRRSDVLRGQTTVRQLFTERIPCSECRGLLSGIPQFRSVPKYYYLNYADKRWQRQQGGGNWGAFLMDCYRLRPD